MGLFYFLFPMHLTEIKRVLQTFEVAFPQGKLVVGVSGGVDSVVLLHLLSFLLPTNRLVVAHLHHELRAEADEDALFVQQMAESYGLPVFIRRRDVRELAMTANLTIEEAGRKERYAFFAAVAQDVEAQAVAVAHHADDQAETVLMRLLRGSGLDGLRAMQAQGVLPNDDRIWLLRPLLNHTKTDIMAYAQQHDLPYRQDASNSETTYLRNRIRHELLPLMQTYNPQIDAHLRQLALIAQEDYAFLNTILDARWPTLVQQQGAGWLALNRQLWQDEPMSIQRLSIRRAMHTLRPYLPNIHFSLIEAIRQLGLQKNSGGMLHLPSDLTLRVEYNQLVFLTPTAVVTDNLPQLDSPHPQPLSVPGTHHFSNNWVLEAVQTTESPETITTNSNPWVCYLQLPSSTTQLIIRRRQPGEIFQPLGLQGQTAKVKEVMINRKIPQRLRPYWPIVATEQHLLWIAGHQQDQRSRVTDPTQPIIQLTCHQTAPA